MRGWCRVRRAVEEILDTGSLQLLDRLEEVEGMTRARVRQLRDQLGQMLSRSARRRARHPTPTTPAPPVELLLAIDEEYRAKAEAGELRTIAPRRFDPDGERWLPVLKAEREGWRFTALFSNTARGPLCGLRVIRGREAECREHYGV